jgi:anti-anti-sigma factor
MLASSSAASGGLVSGESMERRKGARKEVVFRDRQLVVSRTFRPPGLRLVGQVDATNVEGLQSALEEGVQSDGQRPVLHLDLTRLEFSDVSGIRAIVDAAERADGRFRLVLHGLPPLMSRVLGVVGWSDLPALDISNESFPHGQARKSAHQREDVD